MRICAGSMPVRSAPGSATTIDDFVEDSNRKEDSSSSSMGISVRFQTATRWIRPCKVLNDGVGACWRRNTEPPRAPEILVPLDIALAAAANLAYYADAHAPKTLDENSGICFLVEGLRGAAERSRVGLERNTYATVKSPYFLSSEPGGEGREAGTTFEDITPIASSSDETTTEGYYGKVEKVDGYTDLLILMV